MMDCVTKKTRPLPYGLLLTRVFKCAGVKLDEREAVAANAFIDGDSLSQLSLQVSEDGTLEKVPPIQPALFSTSSFLESYSAAPTFQTLIDRLESKLSDIQKDFAEYKQTVNEVKAQNTELLGYLQKAKCAVRAAKATAKEGDKFIAQVADKELSTPPPEISAAVASGSSDAAQNQEQAAVDDLFAD